MVICAGITVVGLFPAVKNAWFIDMADDACNEGYEYYSDEEAH
jgi:hypothetical protein